MENLKWFEANEQPAGAEKSRSWMALLKAEHGGPPFVEVYGSSKEEAEKYARLFTAAPKLMKAADVLLFIISPDKDGSFFICEEAIDQIMDLAKAVDEAREEGTSWTKAYSRA